MQALPRETTGNPMAVGQAQGQKGEWTGMGVIK